MSTTLPPHRPRMLRKTQVTPDSYFRAPQVATPGLAAYQAAKWAVSGFTEVLALETAPLGISVTAIEPGGMQSDWAGSSMSKPPVSQAYQPTVGMVAARMREPGLLPAGDPARIARVAVDLSDMDSPPVRLLLGSDAVTIAEAAAATLAGRDAVWREVSRSTNRDDATAAELDPLGVAAARPVTVVRRFLDEVLNGGNLDLIDELWAEDLAWHGGSLGDIFGLPAFRKFIALAQPRHSPGCLTVEEIVSAGQKVVARFTNRGTQTGPFLGTPPTGRHAEWLGIGIYTVTSGKISQAWFGEDVLGMLMQLGVVTLPG